MDSDRTFLTGFGLVVGGIVLVVCFGIGTCMQTEKRFIAAGYEQVTVVGYEGYVWQKADSCGCGVGK